MIERQSSVSCTCAEKGRLQAIILTGCNYCRTPRLALFAGLHFNQRPLRFGKQEEGLLPTWCLSRKDRGWGGLWRGCPALRNPRGSLLGPDGFWFWSHKAPLDCHPGYLLPRRGGVHGSPNIPHSRFSFLAEKVGRVSSPRLPAKRDQREYFTVVMRGTSHN